MKDLEFLALFHRRLKRALKGHFYSAWALILAAESVIEVCWKSDCVNMLLVLTLIYSDFSWMRVFVKMDQVAAVEFD